MMRLDWWVTAVRPSSVVSTSATLMKRQEQQSLSDLESKIITFFACFINLRRTYLFELKN